MRRVDHPEHYGGASNPYEAIKVIDAWWCNFNTGNSYKYMARAGLKTSAGMSTMEKLIEDLGKARWYLQHQAARLSRGCPTAHIAQPLIVPDVYRFDSVFINVGFSIQLEPAVRACFDQCSHHKVEAGIAALDLSILKAQEAL